MVAWSAPLSVLLKENCSATRRCFLKENLLHSSENSPLKLDTWYSPDSAASFLINSVEPCINAASCYVVLHDGTTAPQLRTWAPSTHCIASSAASSLGLGRTTTLQVVWPIWLGLGQCHSRRQNFSQSTTWGPPCTSAGSAESGARVSRPRPSLLPVLGFNLVSGFSTVILPAARGVRVEPLHCCRRLAWATQYECSRAAAQQASH